MELEAVLLYIVAGIAALSAILGLYAVAIIAGLSAVLVLYWTIRRHQNPSQISAKQESFGSPTEPDTQHETTATQHEPVLATVTQHEPILATVTQHEPILATVTQHEPILATANRSSLPTSSELQRRPFAERTLEDFRKYIEMPAVKESHNLIATSTKQFENGTRTGAFLSRTTVKKFLEIMMPQVAKKLGGAGALASAVGPAGSALGTTAAVLLTAAVTGVHDSDSGAAKSLDKLSRQIDSSLGEIKSCFQKLRISDKLNELLVIVEKFERGRLDRDRLNEIASHYHPHDIIDYLNNIHNTIAGKQEIPFSGTPLFEELAKEGNMLEGVEFDDFVATTCYQFQSLIALQMRALRMLRSLVFIRKEDKQYEEEIQHIIANLRMQQEKHDPFNSYEWYLKVRLFGGVFAISSPSYEGMHMKMSLSLNGVCDPPKSNGQLIITPNKECTYLISSMDEPNQYVYMKKARAFMVDFGVWEGDPGRQGHWKLTIKNFNQQLFVLSTAEWPAWYIYMQGYPGYRMRVWEGDPGPQGHLRLTHLDDASKFFEWYTDFKSHGGLFTISAKKWPDKFVCLSGEIARGCSRTGMSGSAGTSINYFIITPIDDGSFLISTKNETGTQCYISIKKKKKLTFHYHDEDPDTNGHWFLTPVDLENKVFKLSTKKWPNWYIYMDSKCCELCIYKGDPGPSGHFTFTSAYTATLFYKWYTNFLNEGGKFEISAKTWPEKYLCFDGKNVIGCAQSELPEGAATNVFLVSPQNDRSFLISVENDETNAQRYLYMDDKRSGNVASCKGDPGPSGHWVFTPLNWKDKAFKLSTKKWPKRYMYVEDSKKANVRGHSGNPGDKGCFTLLQIK